MVTGYPNQPVLSSGSSNGKESSTNLSKCVQSVVSPPKHQMLPCVRLLNTLPSSQLEPSLQWKKVTESNAILIHLAEKYGWTDLYPQNLRTEIHQYLFWHGGNTRLLSLEIFRPTLLSGLAKQPVRKPNPSFSPRS